MRLSVERDDLTVYEIGDGWLRPGSLLRIAPGGDDVFELPASAQGAAMSVRAEGWRLDHGALAIDARAEPGIAWESSLGVAAASPTRPDGPEAAPSSASVTTSPDGLARLVERGRIDLHALTIPIGEREVFGAGAPFFLALFGRDSLITGIEALVDTPDRLMDILAVLARHQATTFDETTRGQPGQIPHELRLGRMGVFGVAPGTPYFGAIDTAALFVVALGEAMRWFSAFHRRAPHRRNRLATTVHNGTCPRKQVVRGRRQTADRLDPSQGDADHRTTCRPILEPARLQSPRHGRHDAKARAPPFATLLSVRGGRVAV